MPLLKRQRMAFLISSTLLGAAFMVLVVIGLWNLNPSWKRTVKKVEGVPFGIPTGTEFLMGRSYDTTEISNDLPAFQKKLFMKAKNYLEEKKWEQAEPLIQELQRENGQHRAALWIEHWALLIRSDTVPKHWETADSLLEKALLKDPTQPVIINSRGNLAWQRKQYSLAREYWTMAKDLSPNYPSPWYQLGKLYQLEEKFQLAEKYIRTAHSLAKGKDKKIIETLAYLFYTTGQDDSCVAILDWYNKKYSLTPEMRFIKALLWESVGDLVAAEKSYQSLLIEFPQNNRYMIALQSLGKKPPRGKLTEILSKKSKPASGNLIGIEVLAPLVQQYPNNIPLQYALAMAYYSYDMMGHAIGVLDTLLQKDPSFLEAANLKEQAENILADRYRNTFIDQEKMNRRKILVQLNDSMPAKFGTDSLRKNSTQPRNNESKNSEKRVFLGHYLVHWGQYYEDVLNKYKNTGLVPAREDRLIQQFYDGRVEHKYILSFKEDQLWGIGVFLTDTSKSSADLFGSTLRKNYSYSGKGEAIESASCPGYRNFQAVIWETDDTIEMMTQFNGKPNQIRMVRLNRELFSTEPKLCELVKYLDPQKWEGIQK